MTRAATRLDDGTAITFEPLATSTRHPKPRVLLTIEGKVHGEVLNCVLIPVHTIPALIANLQLVASQVRTA